MSLFTDCQVAPATVEAARRGERRAQASLYEGFSTAVFSLALRMVRRRDIAEEILQETFIDVFGKLDTFRGEAPIGAWIRRIAANKCLMHLRSAWHRHARALEPGAEGSADSTRGTRAGIDLEAALGQLSETARAVVWLHDVEGYTHAEIAGLTGKTPSFSKSQLARAHARLRELLEPTSDETPCMRLSNSY